MKWGPPIGRRTAKTALDYATAFCGLTPLAVYFPYQEVYLCPHNPLAPYKVASKAREEGRGSIAQEGLQKQHLKPANQSPL